MIILSLNGIPYPSAMPCLLVDFCLVVSGFFWFCTIPFALFISQYGPHRRNDPKLDSTSTAYTIYSFHNLTLYILHTNDSPICSL